MSHNQIIISLVLLLALVMFAWGKWRHDLVAMATLLCAVVLGVIPSNEAFIGFGHPAVVTVAAVLIISQALDNAGVVTAMGEQLKSWSLGPMGLLFALTAVTTVASAFMNNVGALALLLPVTMMVASKYEVPPAMLLMPLAFGSILGGMTTLIGTPPNIIIANYRQEITGTPFGMFDFAPVGVFVATLGVLFVVLIGWRLIPKARFEKNPSQELFEINNYLTELYVPENSNYIGQSIAEIAAFSENECEVLGVATKSTYARPIEDDHVIQEGEIVIIRCDPADIRPYLSGSGFELMTAASHVFKQPDVHNTILLEAVVPEESPLVNRDVRFLRRQSGHSLALVGLAREGEPVVKRLRRQEFKAGDVLLLLGSEDDIDEQFSHLKLLPLAERNLGIERHRKIGITLSVFAAAILAGMSGWVSLPIAFVLAVTAYVLFGIIRVREIYEKIDWTVIVLLGAMIPVGKALETTGTTDWVAQTLLETTQGLSPVVILILILVVTMFLSDIINNAATVLVMAPISVSIANTLNVNIDSFLMAVAVGASCAFLTPIGHQSNTLVMGPGGYRFSDYWRMGLPLEILIVVIAVPLILWAWPL